MPETQTCEYVDPDTTDECGDDGALYSTRRTGAAASTAEVVCAAHLPVVLVSPPRVPSLGVWRVQCVQEV